MRGARDAPSKVQYGQQVVERVKYYLCTGKNVAASALCGAVRPIHVGIIYAPKVRRHQFQILFRATHRARLITL